MNIKSKKKVIVKTLGYILLFLVFISVTLSISSVQTYLAKILTGELKETYNTNIVINKVDLSFLGSVQLKGVEIRDHHKDTLIFVNNLSTSLLNTRKILNSNINLGDVSLKGVYFYLKTYKDENSNNISIFADNFNTENQEKSTSPTFLLKASDVYINDFTFKVIDENTKQQALFAVKKGSGSFSDLKIVRDNVSVKVKKLSFTDDREIEIINLTTDFFYSDTQMTFKETVIETKDSKLNTDILFTYKFKDLPYFNDRVKIKAEFAKSKLSLTDLNKLYNEFRGDYLLHFSGNMEGTLNDFSAKNIDLSSSDGMKIKADIHLLNSIEMNRGLVFNGHFKDLTANYKQLKSLLPNLVGEKMPSELKRLGDFTLTGNVLINPEKIDAGVAIKSEIGNIITDLELTNITEKKKTKYSGEIKLIDFNLGVLFDKPMLGKATLGGNINGIGFEIDNINTTIIGLINKLEFNNYTYKNLNINGQFRNKLFDGDLTVDDPNLKMKFNGLADFSSKVNKFYFEINVEYANLLETNLYARDSISHLKGKAVLDVVGNTFDDMVGLSTFTNVEYTNQKQVYKFDRFRVTSSIKENIKVIDVYSKDIVSGQLRGNFEFDELSAITQNALGSIYANYTPHKVDSNQFIEFDFAIYNQIIDVFLPEIFIGKNTKMRGKIDAKTDAFKLTFTSPKITGYDNAIDSLYLRMDNKNVLFNTHLTASKIVTKYYNITKLNLLNRTKNDTLFFKSEFKGASRNKETFNMDFFYTFNKNKKAVLGIQKSTFSFEENIWKINSENNKENKITFDLKKKEFEFSSFHLKSKEQKIAFKGFLRDSTHKDLKVDFVKVNLSSFLPSIDNLSLEGILNGHIDFTQKEGLYSPKGNLSISDFKINSFEQGDLDLYIKGENSYQKYAVNLSLGKNKIKNIFAKGFVDFTSKRPILDLSVMLNNFKLNAFSLLGQDILAKMRGEATGNFNLTGFIGNPIMKGELELKNAGLKFPYLNVDYDFEGLTKIRLIDQSFIFDKLTLSDVEHNTKGNVSGSISHQNFNLWYLNLEINTDNILVLNTKEAEESLYYGTAFIKGNIRIYGLTDYLTIDVNAATNLGTTFVIPLNDIKTINNYRLIHFNSAEINKGKKEGNEVVLHSLEGLSLNINLEVTKDAVAEIVIDKTTGSYLKGSGTGDLQIAIDTKGKFIMNGDFTVDEGKYDFKYGGLINKIFQVEKGGTISWIGSPFDADLNITAVYTTRANPAQLLNDFNTNRKIPVNLITRISGGLFNSKQEFDIEIPNVNSTIASELEFKLNDNDINGKTFQFLSLLAFNSFYDPENINLDIRGTTSDAAFRIVSNLMNSEGGKVQFGVDYDFSDKSDIDNLRTYGSMNFSMGTQITDRIIINGKVGVPTGSKTQSSVVGEMKIEVLLNEKGNFRGVFFNRQNEIQYSDEEEGYTQGVGFTYQVNFNTFLGLLRKIGLKKELKKFTKKDSIPARKLVKFNKH